MGSEEQTVGLGLATTVAERLKAGMVLAFSHRDYCGLGLRFAEGEFIYGEVNDGHLPSKSEMKYWHEAGDIERETFVSEAEFISWLSAQSDSSLSGSNLSERWLRDNQRITIARLHQFVTREPYPHEGQVQLAVQRDGPASGGSAR